MNLPDLLDKFARNEATPQEIDAFSAHLAGLSREAYEQLLDAYGERIKAVAVTAAPDTALLATIQQHIDAYNQAQQPVPRIPLVKNRRWLHYSAAAAIIIAVLVGTYFLVDSRPGSSKPAQPATVAQTAPIPPGSNKAVLTLANGRQVILDDARQGAVASQGSVKIIKLDSGIVAYSGSATAGADTKYNTITTPRGGQYQLILPDGTHAWLNAASSLRFPTSFNGRERKVELKGEGYFAVTHDAAHPFIVSFSNTQVEVLGTEFNIMDYDDEPGTQTTLVQGSVRLNFRAQQTLLQPGKMAVVTAGNQNEPVTVRTADVEQVTAWKNGKIALTNADLSTLMRQVSRWYDVNIIYKGAIPDKHFFGLINRSVYLSTLLGFLKENGIHLEQEGRNITIYP